MSLSRYSARLNEGVGARIRDMATQADVTVAEIIRVMILLAEETYGKELIVELAEAGAGDAAYVDGASMRAAVSVDDADDTDTADTGADNADIDHVGADHTDTAGKHTQPTSSGADVHTPVSDLGVDGVTLERLGVQVSDARKAVKKLRYSVPSAVNDLNSAYGFGSVSASLLHLSDQLAGIDDVLAVIEDASVAQGA